MFECIFLSFVHALCVLWAGQDLLILESFHSAPKSRSNLYLRGSLGVTRTSGKRELESDERGGVRQTGQKTTKKISLVQGERLRC